MREFFIAALMVIAWLIWLDPMKPPQDLIDFLEGDHSLVEAVTPGLKKYVAVPQISMPATYSISADFGYYPMANTTIDTTAWQDYRGRR